MPNATNAMTNALQLVQTQTIGALFSQSIHPESGFSLELFRGGNYFGSIQSSQAQPLVAKKGDMLYRINLGPHLQQVTGYLRVEGKYTREYGVQVVLQVVEPSRFLELYRQGRDPVHLAVLDIQAAIQEYADRTAYENIHPTNIQAKATYAFSKEPGNCKAGLRIVSVHNPSLGDDKAFQPIDLHPILTMNGKLPTREGYVRNYLLTIGLSVTDSQLYRDMEHTGTFPLDQAKNTIHNELQSYTSQNFYDDISDAQMRSTILHAFDGVSDRFIGGMEIVHIQHFSLEADKTYQPINLSPIVHMDGQLITREDYVRSYELTVELNVTNYKLYRYLKYSSTENTPIDLAKIAIDGELQKYARQQYYENLNDLQLRSIVEHTFDSFSNHIKECLAIKQVHHLSIGDDKTYKPINLSPLLEVNGKLTTREDYVCDYKFTIEILIKDRRRYQGLIQEGAAPLDHATVAIDGELQKYARQKSYEDLAKIELDRIVEQAFNDLSSRVTYDMEIVRAHRFSLKEPVDYIHLGPRTLTIAGKLETADLRERAYEITVMLEIANGSEFIQLTRRGGDSDPLHLVRMAIEGAIQRRAIGKTHDELSEQDLPPAAYDAFTAFASCTIGGLKIAEAHKVILHVDPRIREKKDIGYQIDVEKTRLEHQADLEKTDKYLKFEIAQQTEMQELALAEPRQAREKAQYIFDLEKKTTIEAQQFRGDLAQKLLAQLTERISQDLEANVPLFEIVEEMKALNSVLQPGIPQNTGGTGSNGYTQLQNSQQPQSPALEAGQFNRHIPQTSSASSTPKLSKEAIPEWGILLTEIPTPAALLASVNDEGRVFQVWELSEEALLQESPFQETDILMKINGRPVYTLKALEAALHSIDGGTKVNVIVLREQALRRLTLDWPSTREIPEQDMDDGSHE